MKREIVAALGLVSQTPIEHLRVFMDQDKPQDTAAFITGMRNECMAICSDFAPYASKVLLPLRLIGEVGGLIRDDGLTPTDLQREKAEETVCYCHCSSILSAWALKNTVCAYRPRELHGFIENDWWRDYTTDFVIEQFKPWSVFFTLEGVAHPKGKEAIFGGMYAGFTVTNGRLKLYCQHALKGKLPHFMLYHEFDMTKGQTLGQV
ncbi:MAG: hypothetical protein Q4E62_05200, partial [Sutterellaceae bacterium]|nr:hypothetical protein [Sutterellaceae bacterium]